MRAYLVVAVSMAALGALALAVIAGWALGSIPAGLTDVFGDDEEEG